MKKLTFFLVVSAMMLFAGNTQAQTFEKGNNVLNLTVGFGSFYWSGTGYSASPGFAASFEHCFWDNLINGDFSIGIGGFFGFQTSKYEYNYGSGYWGYNYTTIAPAGRGTFHWTYVENLDLYAGVHAGWRIVSSKETGTFVGTSEAAKSSGILFGPFVGARYYFTDMFGVVGEMGSGVAYMNLGVALKF